MFPYPFSLFGPSLYSSIFPSSSPSTFDFRTLLQAQLLQQAFRPYLPQQSWPSSSWGIPSSTWNWQQPAPAPVWPSPLVQGSHQGYWDSFQNRWVP